MQQVAMIWEFVTINPWYLACGDMLLMVDLLVSRELDGSSSRTFNVFRLDFSFKPSEWVKVEKLENHALFVSLDQRNPSFACMAPERWGGKSNCIYFAGLFEDPVEPWTAVEIGQPVHKQTIQWVCYSGVFPPDCIILTSLWLFPSLIYGSG
uniref:KIB1-4 beta-propeller domain-containing protein n=1 Tax=Hordeum vulgare subsp. vulgare TaxID=112509 RepID=A0A8I6YLD5_HORVV